MFFNFGDNPSFYSNWAKKRVSRLQKKYEKFLDIRECLPISLFLLVAHHEGFVRKDNLDKEDFVRSFQFELMSHPNAETVAFYEQMIAIFIPILERFSIDEIRALIYILLDDPDVIEPEDMFHAKFDALCQLLYGDKPEDSTFSPDVTEEFVKIIVSAGANPKIYHPYAGPINFLTESRSLGFYYGQEPDILVWAVGKLNIRVKKVETPHVYIHEDPCGRHVSFMDNRKAVLPIYKEHFDYVVLDIFNQLPKYTDRFFRDNFRTNVVSCISGRGDALLKKEGKMLIVVSKDVLTDSDYRQFRTFILERRYLEAIISVSVATDNIFNSEKYVLVLSKADKERSTFRVLLGENFYRTRPEKTGVSVDRDRFNKALESPDDIENQVFIVPFEKAKKRSWHRLSIGSFIDKIEVKEGEKLVELRNILKPIRKTSRVDGVPLPPFIKYIEFNEDWLNKENDFVLDSSNIQKISSERYQWASRIIDEPCLFVALGFLHFKCLVYNHSDPDEKVYVSNHIETFKLMDTSIDYSYLLAQLRSVDVFKQWKDLNSGYGGERDFLEIKIKVPIK